MHALAGLGRQISIITGHLVSFTEKIDACAGWPGSSNSLIAGHLVLFMEKLYPCADCRLHSSWLLDIISSSREELRPANPCVVA